MLWTFVFTAAIAAAAVFCVAGAYAAAVSSPLDAVLLGARVPLRERLRLARETAVYWLEAVYRWGRAKFPKAIWDVEAVRPVVEASGVQVSPEAVVAARALAAGVCLALSAVSLAAGSDLLVLVFFMGALVGYAAPVSFLRSAAGARRVKMAAESLFLAELTAVGVAAGLSPLAAVQEAASGQQGPLFTEVSRMLDEIRLSANFRNVISATAEKLDVPEFTAFADLLSQALETGAAGFVEAIDGLVRHLRELRQAKIEEIAQKAETKLLLPLMLFMVALTMFLLGPLVEQILAVF